MSQIERYLEQNPDIKSSVVGYLLKKKKVLLGERLTSSTDLGLGRVVGLGGEREKGETDEEAFVREVDEESKLTVLKADHRGQVVFLFPDHPVWSQKVQIYLVKEGDWIGRRRKTKSIYPFWVNRNRLPSERMWQDNAIWVPEVLSGKRVNGIFVLEPNGNILEQQFEIIPEAS